MISYIVCGHAHFATGLQSSVKLLFGEPSHIQYIDFTVELSQDTLYEKFEEAYQNLEDASKTVFLTDIVGGTPFKTAVMFSLSHENVWVVSGANLPLLLQTTITDVNDDDIEKQLNEMIASSKEAMFLFDKKAYQ